MSALSQALGELARISADPAPAVSREVFTPLYEEGLRFVEARFAEAGLATRRDAFGNLFGTWPGAEPELPRVLTGSHVDTTLAAGAYDGTVGVLGAVAAVAELRRRGHRPRRGIELVSFAGEEPRFGIGCIGSRALTGQLPPAAVEVLRDRDGVSLGDALAGFGLDPARIGEARVDPAELHCFVELHVEQASVLDAAGEQIGIVEGIAGPRAWRVTVRGRAAHAGATPMRLRRDAGAAACEMVLALERVVGESASEALVGTVGRLRFEPGASNVIAGSAEFDVDLRDVDRAARDAAASRLVAELERIARRRGTPVAIDELGDDPPASCSPALVTLAEEACARRALRHRRMVSGAFHDAMVMASTVETLMLFVPSRDGVSHAPDEFTAAADLDAGALVLADVLAAASA